MLISFCQVGRYEFKKSYQKRFENLYLTSGSVVQYSEYYDAEGNPKFNILGKHYEVKAGSGLDLGVRRHYDDRITSSYTSEYKNTPFSWYGGRFGDIVVALKPYYDDTDGVSVNEKIFDKIYVSSEERGAVGYYNCIYYPYEMPDFRNRIISVVKKFLDDNVNSDNVVTCKLKYCLPFDWGNWVSDNFFLNIEKLEKDDYCQKEFTSFLEFNPVFKKEFDFSLLKNAPLFDEFTFDIFVYEFVPVLTYYPVFLYNELRAVFSTQYKDKYHIYNGSHRWHPVCYSLLRDCSSENIYSSFNSILSF